MRVCLVKMSAIGDLVWSLPLVRSLLTGVPGIELTWVISRGLLPLVEKLEGVHFLAIEKPKSVSAFLAARRALKGLTFDVMIGAQTSMTAHLLYPLIRAKRKIGFDAARSQDGHRFFVRERIPFRKEHTLDALLGFLQPLGVTQAIKDSSIPLTDEDRAFADAIAKQAPFFVINPCASNPMRNWPLERYREVILHVEKTYRLRPIFTGAPRDSATCTQITPHALNLCGKTTLRQLAALLERAAFILAPDTGPIHIASAMGTPAIGLYTDISPALTGPYHHPHTVIDKYPEALLRFRHQQAATAPYNSRVHHPEAMALITVDEVLAKIHIVMEELRKGGNKLGEESPRPFI